ncbi:replication endonuclease [Serratia liquefaciens]|uniref:replication endonuclease n=1 Tax=Serratia liquefaciens TaxID=614 RepID=UPI0022DD4872|nr:replication endonuclease [Serratia liquefaciens]WBL72397.1 replication endonuclease [Serratia liquefaciens]
MARNSGCRHAPTPPLPYPGSGAPACEWAFSWNAPLPVIDPSLNRPAEIDKQTEEQIATTLHAHHLLEQQPQLIQRDVRYHINKLEESQGIRRGNAYLTKNFVERVLPRLDLVSDKYRASDNNSDAALCHRFNHLPDAGRADIELLAKDIAAIIKQELSVIDEETGRSSELLNVMALYKGAAALTRRFKQKPPLWKTYQVARWKMTVENTSPAIMRMMSEDWWLRRLRRHADRWKEHLHIAIGHVSKKATPYASRPTVSDWREQKRRTREFLKSMELEDDEGNRISVIDKYDHSVANPAIRRCELMNRIRGFEDICNEMGFVGEFYTLTAPSRFHATNRHGHRNRKWCGASPEETQRYLRNVWERARAKLHRKGFRIFGIRVAEPHGDGTPHWHMLLFMRPEVVDQVRDILRAYACAEDTDELYSERSRKARFHAEAIDPEKGSATGYIAKYISKNIDGYALDGELDDDSGKELKEIAPAVSAWAARWRIRQFQFIGGAPVTVYRELRRMADHETALGLSVEFAAVHDAADYGHWAEYVNTQGGPFVRRDDLIVRSYYEPAEATNDYGEDVIRIRGVFSPPVGMDTPIITRTKEWKFVPARAVDLAVDVKGAPAPSWSSVNNCTVSPERLKNKQVEEPAPPPENLDFERITDKERRLMLRRIRSAPPEPVKNPFMTVAEGFALPGEGLNLPPIRSVLPDLASNKRWREQVRHEQEQRALAYFSLDDGQEAEHHRPPTASAGINTIKRPLSKLERQIGSFAESIGFSLDACILKSMARGATVTIDGQRYRARADGCLYQQTTPAATTALTRLTALWHRQVPEQTRVVGDHLRKEAAKQKSEE